MKFMQLISLSLLFSYPCSSIRAVRFENGFQPLLKLYSVFTMQNIFNVIATSSIGTLGYLYWQLKQEHIPKSDIEKEIESCISKTNKFVTHEYLEDEINKGLATIVAQTKDTFSKHFAYKTDLDATQSTIKELQNQLHVTQEALKKLENEHFDLQKSVITFSNSLSTMLNEQKIHSEQLKQLPTSISELITTINNIPTTLANNNDFITSIAGACAHKMIESQNKPKTPPWKRNSQ